MILVRARGRPQALSNLFHHLNAIRCKETVLLFFDEDEDPAIYDAYGIGFPDYVWQEPGRMAGIDMPSSASYGECLDMAMRRFPNEPYFTFIGISPANAH